MNRQEFAKVWGYLTAGVPTPAGQPTMEVYYDMLKHIDADTAMLAAKTLLAQSETPFLPAVGKILATVASLQNPNTLTHGEAWENVCRAIREQGGYYAKDRVLNALDPLTRKAVESIGFDAICHSENQDTLRAQFRMAYETLSESQKKDVVVPDDVKRLTEQVGRALSAPTALMRSSEEKFKDFQL